MNASTPKATPPDWKKLAQKREQDKTIKQCSSTDVIEYEKKIIVLKNNKIIDTININGAGGYKSKSCDHHKGDYDLALRSNY